MFKTKLPDGRQDPAYSKYYYWKNRDYQLKKNARYYQENKERLVSLSKLRGYRAMTINLLRQRDGVLCGICKKLLDKGKEEIDHIIPIKLGGTSIAENIHLSHRECNRTKRMPRKELT